MNIRIAKKILHTRVPDPTRKPSEQTPYNDAQWVEAHRVFRLGLHRWRESDPTMRSRPKWAKP